MTRKSTDTDGLFSHIDASGKATMVDISHKVDTYRKAVAKGEILLPAATMLAVSQGSTDKKGDILTVSKIAGIMAAKRTSELIPLCHTLPLSRISVDFTLNNSTNTLEITSIVETYDRTGVEMEALTAVTVTALTVYDMCKSTSHGIVISNIHLVSKTGGKHDYQLHKEHEI